MKTLTKKQIKEIRKDLIHQDWGNISYQYELSESFIREFKDKVNWDLISYCQKLSESFIREFKDKIEWYYISKFQILSEDFIFEFFDRLDIEYILKYRRYLSIETRKKIKLIYELSK